jgi:hypothetical protein
MNIVICRPLPTTEEKIVIMSEPTNVVPQDDELLVVQCCPCGHVYQLRRSELIELIGTTQLDEIAAGQKLDAPILPSSLCEECKEECERQDRLCREADLDVFERTFG